MKHIKLFEDFLNENLIEESKKSADALIDMLSNSMESYSDDKEFIDAAIKSGFSKSESKLLKDIFNKYWDLDAKKRNDYTAKDWAEWLKKSTHGWVFES
jgi:thymidylate synthase